MNECCERLENRREGFGPRGAFSDDPLAAGVSVTHCVVCEARHVEMEADALEMGAEGASL